jgi:hypothetical protein
MTGEVRPVLLKVEIRIPKSTRFRVYFGDQGNVINERRATLSGPAPMRLDQFKKNVEAALQLLSKQKKDDTVPLWLNERALAGISDAGLESLPAETGFPLGAAAARFIRISKEVAEADGVAEQGQIDEAAAALRTIGKILASLPAK